MKTTTSQIDRDTRTATAFDSFAALIARCATGYVPTLPGNYAAERRVRTAVAHAGYRVFPATPAK